MSLNSNSMITLVKKPTVSEIAGEKAMLDFQTGKYFLLKGSANDIWELLCENQSLTMSSLVDKLMQIYQVDEKTCNDSTSLFINQLVQNKFVTIS